MQKTENPIKQTQLANHCPECFSQDTLELRFIKEILKIFYGTIPQIKFFQNFDVINAKLSFIQFVGLKKLNSFMIST